MALGIAPGFFRRTRALTGTALSGARRRHSLCDSIPVPPRRLSCLRRSEPTVTHRLQLACWELGLFRIFAPVPHDVVLRGLPHHRRWVKYLPRTVKWLRAGTHAHPAGPRPDESAKTLGTGRREKMLGQSTRGGVVIGDGDRHPGRFHVRGSAREKPGRLRGADKVRLVACPHSGF